MEGWVIVQNVKKGIKGKMWEWLVLFYVNNRSSIFFEGKSSHFFQLIEGMLKVGPCHLHCF